MENFSVTQPTKIVFGNGAINNLAEEVRALGGSRVFLVIDPGLVAAAWLIGLSPR